ncbi:MAG: YbaB/EbfC family nucleoid-associated protein [Pseudomonadota bacterium]|nr:YbaB/EbfC family nucleoid-associated protein [Pseudomonadota bacterium]
MKGFGNMLKQAQQMQDKMNDLQAELDRLTVEGQAGGGMVKVTLSGKIEMRAIKIDPSIIEPGEAEMIEDLVLAAYNDAKRKAETQAAEKTEALMGGLGLPPGLNLPF